MQKKGKRIEFGKIDDVENMVKGLSMSLPDLETKLNEIQLKVKSNLDGLNSMSTEMDMLEKLSKGIGDQSVIDRIARGKKLLAEKISLCNKLFSRIK
jgi:hypothetical protein